MDAKLSATDKRLDELSGTTKKADSSLAKLGSVAGVVGSVAVKTTAAISAFGAAITAMTLKAASSRRELELFSSQVKTTEENFQALSFATEQYGVNAEQIADISKDIADKLGEFSAAGTGAFQDYADVMKLTREEAQEVAREFETLSSEDVIGRMVANMEAAGATGNQMTFVLESIGNDLSKLQPLFANNSAELSKLKDRFNDVNASLQITDAQAEGLKEVSTSFGLLTSGAGNAATAISATLAPVLNSFINDIIEVVPDATQTMIDLINSFLDAENIKTSAGITQQLEESQARIVKLQQEAKNIAEQDVTFRKDGGVAQQQLLNSISESINLEKIRIQELSTQAEILEQQKQTVEDAQRLTGGEISGDSGGETTGTGTGDQIQAIADRFKDEEQLLTEKLQRELEIVGENNELRLQLEDEYLMALVAMDIAAEEEIAANKAAQSARDLKAAEKVAKAEEKIELGKAQFANRVAQTLLSTSMSTQEKLFSVIKDAAAGQIEAYGLVSGARALAELGPIAGPPVSAQYIAWSQVAANVVRALPLGGGSSVGSVDGDASTTVNTTSSEEATDTSTLDVTEQSEAGTTEIRLVITDESGNEFLDGIASGLEERTRQGR